MRHVVAYLAAVVVVCGLAAGTVVLLAGGREKGGTSTNTSDTRVDLVPGPGQAFLTGDVSKLTVAKAQSPPIPAPFTISAVERGVGRATIANAIVDGRRTSISWSGGTPLPISGAGAIDLAGAKVEVDASGVTWNLDGAGRRIVPGAYRVGAPVAVGEKGLGAPRDGVSFTADAETVLNSEGNVVVRLPLQPVELDGPGGLAATGRLRVQSQTAVTEVGYVEMSEAPFHVRVAPAGSQIVVTAVLQGPFTTDR
ncbi:MAG: hypothetical protein ACRD0Q_06800 [Acidimicrobiales bacterium]